ncbi:NAD(P)-dependent oxidoreductase [Nonomuraea typhae]|uniref:NAD(P)-dependent oxidoreductase n=1 Tax=Nonomuraea typhae TaxID=2603600 RepID=UPI001FE636FD|nr:NAD(P)-binding domain-containing protein [Nonomuraea typhae]
MTPVTIIGLGAIGTALAKAYVAAGHPTTVWNRSASRPTPPGAVRMDRIEDAVAAGDLVIAILTTFEAARQALEPAAGALAGRTLITLNTGTPAGARETAAWAAERGADFLAGAVKNVPSNVGLPDTLLYYSGPRALFDRHQETLQVMGGDTVHLGEEPDLSALYELAVGGTLLPTILGFLQGAALVSARGLPAASLVRYEAKWLEMIIQLLPSLAAAVDTGDYANPESSLGIFHEGIPYDHEIGREGGLDVSWHEPMHDLLRRAVAEGRADQSIASLVELLRKP